MYESSGIYFDYSHQLLRVSKPWQNLLRIKKDKTVNFLVAHAPQYTYIDLPFLNDQAFHSSDKL